MRRDAVVLMAVCLAQYAGAWPRSVAAGVISLDTPIAGGFDRHIDFDLNPLEPGFFFEDDVDLLDQYTGLGVLFRDMPGLFDAPTGGSPGEIDRGAWLSAPNSLEAENDSVFVLFETPVLSAGAFVLAEDHEDDSADDSDDSSDELDGEARLFLDAFSADLQLIGSISIDASGDDWRFIGISSDEPVSAIGFRSESDDFNIDDLGAMIVPEASTWAALLTGGLLLLSRRRVRSLLPT